MNTRSRSNRQVKSEESVQASSDDTGIGIAPDDAQNAQDVSMAPDTTITEGGESPADLLDRVDAPHLAADAPADDECDADLAGLEPFDPQSASGELDALEPDAQLEGAEGEAEQVSSDRAVTDALPIQSDEVAEELTPLPVNAIVGGKYIVQHQLHHSADRNLYRVSARGLQACATCGRLSAEDAIECEYCSAPTNGQPPAEFYLMAEGFYPEALIQDPGLMNLNLYHPNLVPVIDFFSYKPFGRTRYFAVAEPRQGVRLSQMSMPRPPMQVLKWAMQLADALDYLHNRGVVGAGAEADDILVQGETASLASLQNARSSSAGDAERTEQQSMDLARLAGTIYEAYTGNPPSVSPEGMLPTPSGAPEQIGLAFRAAIEPVQGAARPISASHWRDLLATALDAMAELERPGRPVSFISSSLTNVGKLRDQNQDSYGVSEFIQDSEERPFYTGLYVIADGMGGHKGGEFASALAVQAYSGEVIGRVLAPLVSVTGERPAPSNEAILQALLHALYSANDRIYKARTSRHNDMGTTLVSVVISGGKAYIVNIGDSRLYLFSKEEADADQASTDATQPLPLGTSPLDSTAYLANMTQAQAETNKETAKLDRTTGYKLTQVSVDHSLVHRLVELGQLDPEEAKTHPHRNFIYRSLGGAPPVEADTFVRTLHPGDRLLLCSDGLNSMIEDSDIEAVLASEEDPHTACQRLIDLANEAGGHDNITTVLIDVMDYLPYAEPL